MMVFEKGYSYWLGKKRSEETNLKVSINNRMRRPEEQIRQSKTMKRLWKNPNSIFNSEKFRKNKSLSSMREGNPFFGRKHTEESKLKQSLKKLGRPSPRIGAIISRNTRLKQRKAKLGAHLSEEHKKNIGNALRGRKRPKEVTLKVIRSSMKTLAKKGMISDGQKRLYEILDMLKVDYDKRFTIWNPKTKRWYCLDASIPKLKLDIEYDGHSHHYSPEGIRNDRRRDRFLKRDGWGIFRIKRNEIFVNDYIIPKIKELIGD